MELLRSLDHPSREYTPIPFWFLNGDLDHDEIRRRLREIYRLNAPALKQGWDIVVVARQRCVGVDYRKLEAAFLRACQDLKLFREETP